MVLRLPTRTPVEYESHLTRFIQNTQTSAREKEPILFIDCQSTLTKYLRSRVELAPVFNAVHAYVLESGEELLALLRSVDFRLRVQRARYVVISPFYHLLNDASAWKQKKFLLKAENEFERLEEKFSVHVIVAEE